MLIYVVFLLSRQPQKQKMFLLIKDQGASNVLFWTNDMKQVIGNIRIRKNSLSSQIIQQFSLQKFLKEEMGQEHLSKIKEQIHQQDTLPNQNQSPQEFVIEVLKQVETITGKPVTSQELSGHLLGYLSAQSHQQQQAGRKRSRSYELLHLQQKTMEERSNDEADKLSDKCKLLEQKMQWLQETEEDVRMHITEIMVTQQSFKIRQTFRKLARQILKLDNFLLYIVYPDGRLEFHDFKNNYITDIQEEQRVKTIQALIREGFSQEKTPQAMALFDLTSEIEGKENLYSWNVIKENKLNICYVAKSYQGYTCCPLSQKLVSKLASIAMISTSEEEFSIIQKYTKELLQILQICINECEVETCNSLGYLVVSIYQVEKELIRKEQKDEQLFSRVGVFQQLQYELLQRIRMYKKYVCEGDKIFMQFDQSAELCFLSKNFPHPLLRHLPTLWQHQKLFMQQIFEDYKPINQFVKKALQKKLKSSKLYELNFQSKARVKYNSEGRIQRMHVIFEELENSSSSSSNVYNSSSTKILSEGSEKVCQSDVTAKTNEKEHRHSVLMRNLQKQNPGIINQGWINLFVKEQHLVQRQNTYFKNKPGKGYTIKRSISLNKAIESNSEFGQTKDNLHNINIESIDLNLLELQEELLEPLVLKVFKRLQYFNSEFINKQYFENFLADIHNGYQTHNNPFHNFTHGVNVMHTCYLLSHANKNKHILSPSKMFTIVLSGLCHDVGHTGFTNLFQIASGSKKAITYNDNSPLQNFHAASTFEYLRKPQNNFLKNLSMEQMKEFRKLVISSILYTDIKEHFPLLKKFNALIKDQMPRNDEYITILAGMILHAADFGGSAKEFQICKAWSLKVNLEFSNQYKKEGELGLPQTPFMKDLTNISILSKNEGGFLKVIVFPLYQALDQFCGNDLRIRLLREYAQTNIKKWQAIQIQSQNIQKEQKISKE